MGRKQHYMTWDERQKLEALYNAGMKAPRIAKELGFCPQTIYNELDLGLYDHLVDWENVKRYSAYKAQQIHEYRQTNKGKPLKIGNNHAYANRLEDLMLGRQPDGKIDKRKRFSPAAAIAQAKKEGYATQICVTTLYSYIEKGLFLHLTTKDLWEKSKRTKQKKGSVKRVAHPKYPSISERPEYINSREEPGHLEMDLIVSCTGGRGAILTLTERAGRFEMIRKIPDRKAATIRKELIKIRKIYPEIRSITTDNGSEFLQYEELIKAVGCPVYYCHSYAAWEKGTNENHNRMIRRWYPKGTDFSKITKRDLNQCQDWMNNYPRKSLGWMTPNEFWETITRPTKLSRAAPCVSNC